MILKFCKEFYALEDNKICLIYDRLFFSISQIHTHGQEQETRQTRNYQIIENKVKGEKGKAIEL